MKVTQRERFKLLCVHRDIIELWGVALTERDLESAELLGKAGSAIWEVYYSLTTKGDKDEAD